MAITPDLLTFVQLPRAIAVTKYLPALCGVYLLFVVLNSLEGSKSSVSNCILVNAPATSVVAVAVYALNPLLLANTPVEGNPVQFVRVPDVGVPRMGVTKVGEVARAKPPEPVAAVPFSVGALVISKSVNQPLVTREPVAAMEPVIVMLDEPSVISPVTLAEPSKFCPHIVLVLVSVGADPVMLPVMAFVTCRSVNQPLVSLAPVAPSEPVLVILLAPMASVPPMVKLESVPTLCRDDAVTPAASVAPVRVPAGAITTLPAAKVNWPVALTVNDGIEVDEP